MEQFFAVRRFSSALAFTADGAHVLFASNMSGQFNLWRVPVEGGWPHQLTAFSDETVRGVGVSPDGRIVLCADHDGDEFHQLYLLDSERGWPEKLTELDQLAPFGDLPFADLLWQAALGAWPFSRQRAHASARRTARRAM